MTRRVAQECAGLRRARFVDTYATAGTLSAANVPLVLEVARREGSLQDGDVVATFSGGSGETYSSLILRWGR